MGNLRWVLIDKPKNCLVYLWERGGRRKIKAANKSLPRGREEKGVKDQKNFLKLTLAQL